LVSRLILSQPRRRGTDWRGGNRLKNNCNYSRSRKEIYRTVARDYSVYDRCPIHDCVMLIVAKDAKPQCMVEWLLERARG